MNISMPEDMRRWIESIVAQEQFGTSSEYVRSLIREDRRRRLKEQIEQKLVEALDSPSAELTGADWDDVRARVAGKNRSRSST